MRFQRFTPAILALFVAAQGCGVKGDPIPYVEAYQATSETAPPAPTPSPTPTPTPAPKKAAEPRKGKAPKKKN